MRFIHIRFIALLIVLLTAFSLKANAQQENETGGLDEVRREYTVGRVTISGGQYLDTAVLKSIMGLSTGEKIILPDDEKISKAIKTIWGQGLLEDLAVNITAIRGDVVDLDIAIRERPKLNSYFITGIPKGQQSEIKEQLDKNMKDTRIITEGIKVELKERVKKFYLDKGFANVEVSLSERNVSKGTTKAIDLIIDIRKGKKVKINQINIVGNDGATDKRLKKTMKNTKEMARLSLYPADKISVYGAEHTSFREYLNNGGYLHPSQTLDYLDPYFRYKIFSASKFNKYKYELDKESMMRYYNSIGYRDAQIEKDTVYNVAKSNINVDIKIEEGRKYYFGDIEWSGNTKYPDSVLTYVLGIKRGDVFNQDLIDGKLGLAPNMDGSMDLGSLYSDQGYLFFRASAQETSIDNDTINFRINITEGPETTIKRVTITGNNRTNDHVIRRELFTLPGYKYSRADLIRSIRQIATLGYIDPEKVNPVQKPNFADQTVDIEYQVAEKSNDQIEVTAGYGGGIGFTGSAGITLNNFSLSQLMHIRKLRGLPMGDGQTLAFRWQSNGIYYNNVNLSFTEPWLGGKKPIGLTIGATYGRFSLGTYFDGNNPNDSYLRNYGANISLSKRLKWPDDNFVGSIGLNYQNYYLKDYNLFNGVEFSNGTSNNLNFIIGISRNSVDQPVFPRSGSNLSLLLQFTPPFSLFSDDDYSTKTPQEKFKLIEYHKYRFNAEWYQKLVGDLTLRLAGKFGYVGFYNRDIGFSPFERFQLGGDGLSGGNYFVGRDVLAHRGYEIYTQNATIFNKYTAEVRYPFSLNPNSTVYGLAFFEAANGWNNFKEYNPLRLNRSVGVGVRIRLPAFGLLGLDYGFGFDRFYPGNKFGSAAKLSFLIGREPD